MINLGGRPTKYTEDMPERADEYLATCVDSFEGKIKKVNLPTEEGFAHFLGVGVSTIFAWANKYPAFQESLAYIKGEQKKKLISEGLADNYNSTIAKLMLSSNHGMREGTDHTSGGKTFEGIKVYLPIENE